MSGAKRPTVAVLLTGATRGMVLADETRARLAEVAELREAPPDPAAWDRRGLLQGAVACLTGWGTPGFDVALLDACPDLRLVAHTAGSVRGLLPVEAIGGRVRVCQAAALIADSVAELVILQILTSLRELHLHDRGLREGTGWADLRARHPGRLLGAMTVGVIGASRTGRAVLELLRPFGARLLAHDPYLTPQAANELGVEPLPLDDLLAQSDVVTLHVPLLPATEGMIGAPQLRLLHDGALFVNSARAGLVDPTALRHELETGRIRAALDVFPEEPLPTDSPWRTLPGTVISPHTAGHTVDGHLRQGEAMAADVIRFLRGEPLRHEITGDLTSAMA